MLSPQQIREIAAAAMCDLRTVSRCYGGAEQCRPTLIERITRAAVELGIEPPKAKPTDKPTENPVGFE